MYAKYSADDIFLHILVIMDFLGGFCYWLYTIVYIFFSSFIYFNFYSANFFIVLFNLLKLFCYIKFITRILNYKKKKKKKKKKE